MGEFCQGNLVQSFILKMHTLQIPNSLGDKFSHWNSKNETLIIHYEKKKTETSLNVSYFEKIMSHWQCIW